MPAMFVDTMYSAEHIIVSGGQTAVLRRYYRCEQLSGVDLLTEQAVASAMADVFQPLYSPLIWNGAEYRGLLLTRASGPLPLTISTIGTPTAAGSGTGGTTAISKQSAGLITLKTANQGKKNRGRQFVPFPSASANQGAGIPTLLYLLDLTNLGVELRTTRLYGNVGLTAQCEMTPVIWKKGAVAFSRIDAMVARRAWATQRRRGDFGRLNASPI